MILFIQLAATLLILGLASYEDIKIRRISKYFVALLYLITIFFVIITDNINSDVTMAFLFTFIVFMFISLISHGGFGIGDSMVLAAIAWQIGNLEQLQIFFLILGIMAMIWAVFWILWLYRRNGYDQFSKGIRQIHTIPIDKIQPGMVLASDYFMQGLTEKDIQKMKEKGYTLVDVKQPLPFIPVIFISTMFFWLLLLF